MAIPASRCPVALRIGPSGLRRLRRERCRVFHGGLQGREVCGAQRLVVASPAPACSVLLHPLVCPRVEVLRAPRLVAALSAPACTLDLFTRRPLQPRAPLRTCTLDTLPLPSCAWRPPPGLEPLPFQLCSANQVAPSVRASFLTSHVGKDVQYEHLHFKLTDLVKITFDMYTDIARDIVKAIRSFGGFEVEEEEFLRLLSSCGYRERRLYQLVLRRLINKDSVVSVASPQPISTVLVNPKFEDSVS
eukprot:CAMPEP_0203891118 /NCGR_PEP_ID=MMETSP0359-20131031/34456_1 /ASSEMBLY_ACC=CAM_ASM_000338 /TAXON_ID=268821 /ORGANISM="Scrippsiella Hangoei, Strain SHTV-5" /LENGTH=245 /DNA_ID=CAMNT_0050812853 /DNA_START=123 /DNA_END=860 /DNA_ORIENTATION=-